MIRSEPHPGDLVRKAAMKYRRIILLLIEQGEKPFRDVIFIIFARQTISLPFRTAAYCQS